MYKTGFYDTEDIKDIVSAIQDIEYIEEVRNGKTRLIFEDVSRIEENYIRSIEDSIKKSREPINAENIIIGKPVRGENFFGRDNIVREITYKLKTGSSIILAAPRRYGKTSVMFAVEDRLKDDGIGYIHIDLNKIYNKRELAEDIISKTYKSFGFDGSIERLKNATSELVKGFMSQAQRIGVQYESVGLDLATKLLRSEHEKTDEELLSFALSLPGNLARRSKKKFVFAIDEFGEIDEYQSTKGELIKKMRSIFQTHENVSYFFTGSQTALLNNVFANEKSAFYRFGELYELKTMKRHEFKAHIKKLFNAIGLENIDIDNYNEQVYRLSNGIPHYYMAITKEIITDVVVYGRKNINNITINRAFMQVYDRERNFFDQQLKPVKGKKYQSIILASVAVGASPYAILADYGFAPGNVKKEIDKMEKTGLISYRPGAETKYIINDPFLQRYIVKNIQSGIALRERMRIEKKLEKESPALAWLRQQMELENKQKEQDNTKQIEQKPKKQK